MANSRKRRLPDLLSARVEASLSRHFLPDQPVRVCLGLSGGLDSIALLHILAGLRARWAFQLCAVHVHHGLSPHADAWTDFVSQYAAALNVPCACVRVDVLRRDVLGLEAAARAARYAVFERQACEFLLLAQHQDDQAETVLLNLLRGSGVRGLAAMPQRRSLQSGAQILRPLLSSQRAELHDYAQAHALSWVEDESNADQSLSRNFLRHSILAPLRTVFPGASAALARSAAHLAEADTLLTEIAQQDVQTCLVDGAYDLEAAASLSLVRARNALRYWLSCAGIVPDSRAFDELQRMMASAQGDAEPVWIWRSQALRRYQARLHITAAHFAHGPAQHCEWRDGADMAFPDWRGVLCWEKTAGARGLGEQFLHRELSLRPRTGGEGLRIQPEGRTRKLKNLYQEAGILPWVRESTPLLWIDDRLAAVPGYWIAAEFAVPGGWQPSWQVTKDCSAG